METRLSLTVETRFSHCVCIHLLKEYIITVTSVHAYLLIETSLDTLKYVNLLNKQTSVGDSKDQGTICANVKITRNCITM